jgi:hypothetical protein
VKGRLCRVVVTATTIPKRNRNATVMGRGPTDEAVVVVKRDAVDHAGDRVRGQNISKAFPLRGNGGEGRNMLSSFNFHKELLPQDQP